MSEDERDLSEDDGTDLFESETEDHDSVKHSIDLPALSLDALYVGPPRQTEERDGGEGVQLEITGCETEETGVGGIDIGDTASSPSKQIDDSAVGQEAKHLEDDLSGEGDNLDQQEINRPSDDVQNEKVDVEEGIAVTQPLTKCESPRLPERDQHRQDGADEKQPCQNGDIPDQSTDVQHEGLTSKNKPNENGDPGLIPTPTRGDKILTKTDLDELSPAPPTGSEPLADEPNRGSTTHDSVVTKDETIAKLSTHDSLEQNTGVYKSPASESLAKSPVYTVASLFPVVYESAVPNTPVTPPESAKVVPLPIASTKVHGPTRRQRTEISGTKGIASRLAALQAQLDAARSELANATRTHKIQILMVENDNKKLLQRNARLKSQLSVVTADLQRSNAEMAKLRAENELYAAKLPRLQAELLEETSQVDETQARSVQNQLVLTQLKARSHVLQTRNLALEAQNNKLTQQIRECQQQLKRKVSALQQQVEKTTNLEADLNDLKTAHTQEKLDWKHRMARALHRFEHDKSKLEAQLKRKERKDLREAKDRAEKAVQKRRTAEATTAKLEEQLKHCKHELTSANESAQRHLHEVRTLEALLRKAHRTEATLRNDLAVCKTRLRTVQDEQRRSMARSSTMQTRRRRLEHQIPIELLLPLTDSSDDDDEDNQETQCCSHLKLVSTKVIGPKSPLPSSSDCSECPRLQNQLHQLQQELCRVRSLHNAELHAQASVLDALLHGKQLEAT